MEPSLAQRYKTTLAHYLQEEAVGSIYDFMNRHCVSLHITRDRKSKLGDYRWPQEGYPHHTISINGSLNPYMFLLVMLHEQAHLLTYEQHALAVKPHGHEWQENYRRLLRQYAERGLFPPESLVLLHRYTAQIPLYAPACRELERLFMRYDRQGQLLPQAAAAVTTLNDLPLGATFRLQGRPDMLFVCEEKLRTRYRCHEVRSRRAYLVSGNAPVEREEKD